MRERFKETQNTQSFIPSFGLNSSVILIKLVQRAQSALAKDNAAGSANRSLRHLPSPPRHIAFPPPFLGSRRRLTLGKRGRGERGGGRSAGRPGAPARSLTRAPASPGRAAPRSGAGRWCCGGAAQRDWPGRCEPVLRQPASGASGWTTLQARPAAALP